MFDFSTFIEAIQSPAIATDSTSKILSINKCSETLLELGTKELGGENITAILRAVRDLIIYKPADPKHYWILQEYTRRNNRIRDIDIQFNH